MTEPLMATELDGLITESIADDRLMLDELSVAALVELMNARDAHVVAAVQRVSGSLTTAIEATSERMRRGGRLIYVGAGTSGRLGVLDASEVPPTFGTSGDVVVGLIAGGVGALTSSIEAAEDNRDAGAADLAALSPNPVDTVVGIASSGRTPYVLGAIAKADEAGALTVGISCNRDTPLSALAVHGIEIDVGPEIVTGSTRLGAGTATKMALNMFSTISMIQLGKTYKTLMVDVRATNAKLVHRAVRIVMSATGAQEREAREALDAAQWSAKLAIAMIASGLSAGDAQRALDAAGGRLSAIVSAFKAEEGGE